VLGGVRQLKLPMHECAVLRCKNGWSFQAHCPDSLVNPTPEQAG
jgi:hypothetical protein